MWYDGIPRVKPEEYYYTIIPCEGYNPYLVHLTVLHVADFYNDATAQTLGGVFSHKPWAIFVRVNETSRVS